VTGVFVIAWELQRNRPGIAN